MDETWLGDTYWENNLKRLRVPKRNNVIIFGLPESNASESEETEIEVLLLIHDLGAQLNTAIDVQSM